MILYFLLHVPTYKNLVLALQQYTVEPVLEDHPKNVVSQGRCYLVTGYTKNRVRSV